MKDLVRKLFKQEPVNDIDALGKAEDMTSSKEVATALFQEYKERKDMVERKGRKFANLIRQKYGMRNLPFNKYYKKALKYKSKYKLSDEEFEVFWQVSTAGKNNLTNVFNLPNTKMAGLLGYSGVATGSKLNCKDSDLGHVQEIVRMYNETKELHFRVTQQSLLYRNDNSGTGIPEQSKVLPGVVTSSRFLRDYTTTDRFSFVHPVICALYSWKLDYLEEHTVIGNIGHIVRCKSDGRPLTTQPDYNLYWNLITDPNDTVCDMKSPIVDLKLRYQLQCRLWDSVLNLRQGRCFNDKLNHFLTAVDSCRVNLFDAPDLTYVRDEGTILRRILSAFSIRPTVISSTPIWNMLTYNPHFTKPAITQVTTIPMITYRLPHNKLVNFQKFRQSGNSNTLGTIGPNLSYDFQDALYQAEWFVEGRLLVPKSKQVLHSRGVLIFYVNRRYKRLSVGHAGVPYSFNYLPMTVSGLERINTAPMRSIRKITDVGYNNNSFTLASCVVSKTEAIKDRDEINKDSRADVVVGCATYVFDHYSDNGTCMISDRCWKYDPSRTNLSGRATTSLSGNQVGYDQTNYSAHPWTKTDTGDSAKAGLDHQGRQQPLAEVQGSGTGAMKDCQTHGTIFIYRKDDCGSDGRGSGSGSGSGSGPSGSGSGPSGSTGPSGSRGRRLTPEQTQEVTRGRTTLRRSPEPRRAGIPNQMEYVFGNQAEDVLRINPDARLSPAFIGTTEGDLARRGNIKRDFAELLRLEKEQRDILKRPNLNYSQKQAAESEQKRLKAEIKKYRDYQKANPGLMLGGSEEEL
jgi:hypothetical protein